MANEHRGEPRHEQAAEVHTRRHEHQPHGDREDHGVTAQLGPVELSEGVYGGGDKFCARLGGTLTSPYILTFDPAQNTCIFTKVTEGAPLPELVQADFACVLP